MAALRRRLLADGRPGWRLLGSNAMLLASDLEAATGQPEFLARAVASSAGRQLALFVHKPCSMPRPPRRRSPAAANPAARERLLAAFGARKPALVASGHVHQYRSTDSEGMRCVWGPSTGFIMPDHRQPIYGEKEVGYVEHRFEPDGGYSGSLVRVASLQRLNIADFADAFGKAG
jgi:hypothetical protein